MPKLSQMLLMLSSDQDGEVVAAARAIGRVLVKDKKDWHWLAARLDGVESSKETPRQKTRSKTTDDFVGKDWKDFLPSDIASCLINEFGHRLSDWEADFLNSMSTWEGRATPKQDAALKRIATKFGWWVEETN